MEQLGWYVRSSLQKFVQNHHDPATEVLWLTLAEAEDFVRTGNAPERQPKQICLNVAKVQEVRTDRRLSATI